MVPHRAHLFFLIYEISHFLAVKISWFKIFFVSPIVCTFQWIRGRYVYWTGGHSGRDHIQKNRGLGVAMYIGLEVIAVETTYKKTVD